MSELRPASSQALTVEVVFDFVCPWCRIGLTRLKRVLAERPGPPLAVSWRPFLLNPDMPSSGIGRHDYLLRKFGSEERARRLYAAIAEIGRGEGLEFRFDRIQLTPPTVDAHRLTRFAERAGAAGPLVKAILDRFFEDGANIGDHQILADIAHSVGLNRQASLAFLASGAEADLVHAENLRAHRLGVNGVPCFVLAGRHAIAGAQEPEVIQRLLEFVAMESLA